MGSNVQSLAHVYFFSRCTHGALIPSCWQRRLDAYSHDTTPYCFQLVANLIHWKAPDAVKASTRVSCQAIRPICLGLEVPGPTEPWFSTRKVWSPHDTLAPGTPFRNKCTSYYCVCLVLDIPVRWSISRSGMQCSVRVLNNFPGSVAVD